MLGRSRGVGMAERARVGIVAVWLRFSVLGGGTEEDPGCNESFRVSVVDCRMS